MLILFLNRGSYCFYTVFIAKSITIIYTDYIKMLKEKIMLTSKQRAFLRGMANGLEPIFHVGKYGVTPELVNAVDEALEARELIKANILDNCLIDTRDAAQMMADRTRSDVVQVIGNRFVLYRAARKPVIELPKAKKG